MSKKTQPQSQSGDDETVEAAPKATQTQSPPTVPAPKIRPAALALEVSCPSGPRRRAGLTLGPDAVLFAPGELEPEQIDALRADPLLVVRLREADAPAP